MNRRNRLSQLGLVSTLAVMIAGSAAAPALAVSLPVPGPVTSTVTSTVTAVAGAPGSGALVQVPSSTRIVSGDDRVARVALPRPISLLGVTTSEVVVSTNGLVTLSGAGTTRYSNTPLPTTDSSLRYTLAPFWTDLITTVTAGPAGSSQDPQFVFEWTGNYYYNSNVPVQFQVILHLLQGTAEYRYGQTPFAGRPVTIGAMGGSPRDAFQISFGQPRLPAGGYVLGRLQDLAPPPPVASGGSGSSSGAVGYSNRTTYRGYNPGFAPYGRPSVPVAPPVVTLPNTAGDTNYSFFDEDD